MAKKTIASNTTTKKAAERQALKDGLQPTLDRAKRTAVVGAKKAKAHVSRNKARYIAGGLAAVGAGANHLFSRKGDAEPRAGNYYDRANNMVTDGLVAAGHIGRTKQAVEYNRNREPD